METEALAAKIFRALGHPVRIKILNLLRGEEECVCHLTAILGLPQPYVSQQLAVLRKAGLVLSRKEGLNIYYRLADQRIPYLLDTLLDFLGYRKGEPNLAFTVLGPVRLPAVCCCPKCRASAEMAQEAVSG